MFEDILGKKKEKPKRKVLINLKDKECESFDELRRRILKAIADSNKSKDYR